MIEDVKRIRLEELETQKQEEMSKHYAESRKLTELRKEYDELTQKENLPVVRFSVFERLLTKRKEYKEYMRQIKEKPRATARKTQILQELEKESGIIQENSVKLESVQRQIMYVSDAKTLSDLQIKPEEAIKMLEERGVEPVLTEQDKEVTMRERKYDSKSSFILVHKTKYMPEEGMLKTAKDAHVKLQKKIIINDNEYNILFGHERDTIHMSVNDEVASHSYGSWDDCTYAVLIPFEDMPNEKIAGAATVDTFSKGSIKLPKSAWILCPKSETKKVKACNPDVHVIGYEGRTVQDFSKPFLTQLGYRGENVGTSSWEDRESSEEFHKVMEQEGIITESHSTSHNKEDENILIRINYAVALSKLLKDKGLIKSKEDARDILKQLDDQNVGYRTFIGGLCEDSFLADEDRRRDESAIVANQKQAEIFIRKMEESGFTISPTYQEVIKRLGKVTRIGCNKDNIDEVFEVDENASEEEKKNIMELKEVFLETEDGAKRDDVFGDFIGKIVTDSILKQRDKDITIQEER